MKRPWLWIGGCAAGAWAFGTAAAYCDSIHAQWLRDSLTIPTFLLAVAAIWLFIDHVVGR